MVDLKNRLIEENAHNLPFIFYLKNGGVLKSRGVDKKRTFITMFFILDKNAEEDKNCLILKPLIPVTYCKQTLLKSTDSKVIVRKDCILGMQCLPNAEISDVVIEHHHFNEHVCGKFTIPKGFSETVIWKSNDDNIIFNLMELVYEDGDKEYLEATISSENGAYKTYKLNKHVPLEIRVPNGYFVKIVKKDNSVKASGRFKVEFISDVVKKVFL